MHRKKVLSLAVIALVIIVLAGCSISFHGVLSGKIIATKYGEEVEIVSVDMDVVNLDKDQEVPDLEIETSTSEDGPEATYSFST